MARSVEKKKGKLKYFTESQHYGDIFSISYSAASRQNLATSISNSNALRKLQQNAEGLYSCLIC